MTGTRNRVSVLLAILLTTMMLQAAYAGQATSPVAAPHQLDARLPAVDREVLAGHIRTLRSQLIARKQALLQSVAERKIDSGDAIITAVMPGGLLYAGYKKLRHDQVVNELAGVSADIEELSADLLAMQSMSAPVFVARLP